MLISDASGCLLKCCDCGDAPLNVESSRLCGCSTHSSRLFCILACCCSCARGLVVAPPSLWGREAAAAAEPLLLICREAGATGGAAAAAASGQCMSFVAKQVVGGDGCDKV
jgi:hypothetical protein